MIPRNLYTNLVHIVDNLIGFEEFAGRPTPVPAQFADFSGFLRPLKIQHLGALVAPRPPQLVYGLKRDRRKLHVEPLHLPPEDVRAPGRDKNQHSASNGSLQSSGGSFCASGKAFDF